MVRIIARGRCNAEQSGSKGLNEPGATSTESERVGPRPRHPRAYVRLSSRWAGATCQNKTSSWAGMCANGVGLESCCAGVTWPELGQSHGLHECEKGPSLRVCFMMVQCLLDLPILLLSFLLLLGGYGSWEYFPL